MSKDIDGVHVVTVTEDSSDTKEPKYKLNEELLKSILMDEKIKDLPVVVVSVAGAYRGGKSFLLNFFLRYLVADPSAQDNGSWIGDNQKELTGFSWRGGSERNTTGILMWPTPFIITISSTKKVAVLLMDTQGTFDSNSSVRDCSTIFALSTLLSSTQIYNLKDNIKEDDLQNLQLFTDYGKLMTDEAGKPFQVLEFLIRDWMNPYEYPYGEAGGELYLANKLKIMPTQPKELQDVRRHIANSFDKVACFLMPHPGLAVASPLFKGRSAEMTNDFSQGLMDLTISIFSKDKLSVKMLAGQPLKCRELFNYFKMYMSIFNSDEIPEPKTIFVMTAEAGLLMAANEAREQFEDNMKTACGPDSPSMPTADVIAIHSQEVAAARATFKARKLFGQKADIDKKLEELNKELTERQNDYMEINKSKTMKAMNSGVAAYEAFIQTLTQGKIICVHSKDLKQVHAEALVAAKVAFDANRTKLSPDRADPEREKFILDFQNKYDVLYLYNEQNNKSNANDVRSDYVNYMMGKCNADIKLNKEEFKKEHEKAMARALEEFDSRRNRPNKYTEDVFRFNLEQSLVNEFRQLEYMNVSSNSKAFQLAMVVYNESALNPKELRKHCMHPDALKLSHEQAKCTALQAFSPKRNCNEGFRKNDADEAILMIMFESRFDTLSEINDTANEIAVREAFEVYVKEFDNQCGFFYIFESWKTAKGYHDIALSKANETFYSKRHSRKRYSTDTYLDDLERRAKKYYNPKNKPTN